MQMVKATRLDQVYSAFSTRPLAIEELDEYYLNTALARGDNNPRWSIANRLKHKDTGNLQFLFIGYRGCGKSTELNRLQRDVQEHFLVLNYSVQEELDPVHLNYIELFIVTMERLFKTAQENNLTISEAYLKSVQTWVSSREIQEIKETYIGNEKDNDYSVEALGKFFEQFRLSAKTSSSLKDVLKTNVEPRLSALINHCNDLINEIRIQLHRQQRDLLIIVEDLDKIPLERAKDLFLNYANQLTQLKAKVIFTFPIAIYHSQHFKEVQSYFSDIYELPMINVTNSNGTENAEGINAMHDIVARRMDIQNLFESPNILKTMILYSGGVLRDLFLLLREAADRAMYQDRKKINEQDWLRSLQKMKKEYANNISDDTFGDRDGLKVEDYYKALKALLDNPARQVENSNAVMHLRQNLSILGYDGEGWCDVHPILKDILRDRGKI